MKTKPQTTLNQALRHRLRHLLRLGSEGLLQGDPEALAVLFTLAADLLEGDERRTAEELAAWYDAEAQSE